MKLYVSTSNAGKLRELQAAAVAFSLDIEPLPNLKAIAAPEETGKTFEENAIAKALYYSQFTHEAVLCDDSGLELDALYGAPGVFSARFAGPNATDQDNNNHLLSRLGNVAVRTARFVCVAAVARTRELLGTARGAVEGEILAAPRGHAGFGYDPLFLYPPLQKTFAELTPEEKLSVSHRGRAVRALLSGPLAASHLR